MSAEQPPQKRATHRDRQKKKIKGMKSVFCKLELAMGKDGSSQMKTVNGPTEQTWLEPSYSNEHREGMNPRVPSPAHARIQHLSQAWEWGICEMTLRLKVKCTKKHLLPRCQPNRSPNACYLNLPRMCLVLQLSVQLIRHLLPGDMFSREQFSFLIGNKMWSQEIHERLAHLQLCIGPRGNKAPSPLAIKACSVPTALCLGCSFHWLCFSSTHFSLLTGSSHLCLLNPAHSQGFSNLISNISPLLSDCKTICAPCSSQTLKSPPCP